MNIKNPHSICTWDKQSNCDNCDIDQNLACRPDKEYRKQFIIKHLTFRLTAFLGLLLIGAFINNWILTIAYAAIMFLNFAIVEPRLLCSHCPFYAEKGFILHCNTLYGLPKLWKYRPGPISKTEKTLQLIMGGVVDLFPIIAFIYGIVALFINMTTLAEKIAMIGITIILALEMIDFNNMLQNNLCTKCPNFSCVMNKTSKQVRDEYIKKNPVMKKAWEAKGYKFDK